MPTGLDWLPEVPAHWTVQQIKRRCDLLRGKFSHRPRNDPALYDGEYPFVQTGDITLRRSTSEATHRLLTNSDLASARCFPKERSSCRIAANVGDVAILDFEACFPDSMVGLVPDHHTAPRFSLLLDASDEGRSASLGGSHDSDEPQLRSVLEPISPLFRPRREQEAIAAFLDAKTAEVRAVKAVLHRQIATLVAYRKSLIHECVTGQRRVTEADVRGRIGIQRNDR